MKNRINPRSPLQKLRLGATKACTAVIAICIVLAIGEGVIDLLTKQGHAYSLAIWTAAVTVLLAMLADFWQRTSIGGKIGYMLTLYALTGIGGILITLILTAIN